MFISSRNAEKTLSVVKTFHTFFGSTNIFKVKNYRFWGPVAPKGSIALARFSVLPTQVDAVYSWL